MAPVAGELLAPGDPLPHEHRLPTVPVQVRERFVGTWVTELVEQVNAVAACGSCGRLFVSREDPDGWGPSVRWVPLRWWHRRAHRKLRERGRLTP